MHTIKITTSQNIDIDYEVAGLGERILARLTDLGIFLFIFLMGLMIVIKANIKSDFYTFLPISFLIIFIFYDLVCEVFFNGQSIGKKTLKIKVISLDGGRPTLGQYLLRWVFRMVDFSLTGQIGGLIAVSLTKNKQRIGDIVANTTLVKTNPKTKVEDISFRKVAADDYEIVFNEVAHLRDKDIYLINEVIDSFYKSGNTVLLHKLSYQIKEHLKIGNNMPDLKFLETILKDYNHYQNKLEA